MTGLRRIGPDYRIVTEKMVCFSATIGKIKAHLTKTSIVTENRIDFSVTMLMISDPVSERKVVFFVRSRKIVNGRSRDICLHRCACWSHATA